MKRAAWSRWLRNVFQQSAKSQTRRSRSRKLRLEDLEQRLAPATFTWDGGGDDQLWSNPVNWVGDAAPSAGDDLVFPANAAQFTAQNDFEGVAFNSISFSGSGYELIGQPLTLGSAAGNTGFIVANLGSTNNVIRFDVVMGGVAGNRQFFTVGTAGAELTIDGRLIGQTGVELSKDGPGTLILTRDNSGFNGPITITQGALRITNANALGDTSSPTTVLSTFLGSGQLQIASVTDAINEPLRLNGPGLLNDGALLNFAGNSVIAGAIILDSNSTIGANPGTSLTLNGVISDSGSGHSLTKEGPGTIILDPLGTASGNTYRGQTFVNAGILSIRHSQALGNNPIPVRGVNDTVVQSFPNRSGTLRLEFVANPARIDPFVNADGDGFTVPFEALTLNGPGFEGIHVFPRNSAGTTVSGALNNFSGNNTWTQDVTLWSGDTSVNGDPAFWIFGGSSAVVAIGAETGTSLTLPGRLNDDNLSGTTELTTMQYGFAKTKGGRLILVSQNTYRGRTEILQGFLNIRDSQALGAATLGDPRNGTFVFPNATLELEADQIPDSQAPFVDPPHALPHLNTDIVITNENLRPMGDGAQNTGAIRNIRGVNEITGNIQLQRIIPRGNVSFNGVGASFGVEPDYGPDFLPFDRSQLTMSGVIGDEPDQFVNPRNSQLTKFGGGELVLTNSNTYTGPTFIREGWVTARNNRALGQDLGSASNTGPISPDTVQPATFIAEGAALHLKETRAFNPQPINLPERIFASGVGITHRFEELSQRGAILNLSNFNTISGIVNLVATTAFPQVGIGADIDSTDTSVTFSELRFTNLIQQSTTNTANPNGTITLAEAGINKLGRKRIYLQGEGTYTGDNQITEGVLRIQSNTALGMLEGTTTVLDGAALELAPYVAALHGGLSNGIQIREQLVLNGLGNVTADDPTHGYTNPSFLVQTLTNVAADNIWNGPIVLETDVNLDTRSNTRLGFWQTISGAGGYVKNGAGKLVLGGDNTYTGLTTIATGIVNVQSASALGSTVGGTIVSADAALELQGDVTIAGEPLAVLGNGPDVGSSLVPTWFNVGPSPMTNNNVAGSSSIGRVTSVTVDQNDSNVIYVTSADGGLWRTKNGGLTWESLLNTPAALGAAGVTTLFASSVSISPVNSNVLYVGLGESNNSIDSFYGQGVLRSTDYGATWTLLQPPTPGFIRQTISKIVADPTNPLVVFMTVQPSAANSNTGATANGGLWRFDDRGGAGIWTNLTGGLIPSAGQTTGFTNTQNFTDLVVLNANPRLSDPTYPNQPDRRIILATLGSTAGSTTEFSSVYVWVDNGTDTLGGPGFVPNDPVTQWNPLGFTVATEDVVGRSGLVYTGQQTIGTIKITGQRSGNTVTSYAAAAYPTNAANIDRGTDGRFRDIYSTTITYNPADNLWTGGTFAAMGTQPPSNDTGTAVDSVFGEQGWYNSVVSVNPTNANFLFLGGVGGPGTADGPWVWNGTIWTDVNQALGAGPHVNYHGAGWDSSGRLVVGTDGGVWRMEATTPPITPPTWTNLNGNFLQISQTTGLDVHPYLPFTAIAGFNMNGTALWDDSYTWTQTDGEQGGTVFINNNNPLIVFHARDNQLRRSLDGGLTWATIVAGPTIDLPRINQTPISPIAVPGNQAFYPNTILNPPAFPGTIDLNFPFVLDRVNTSRLIYGGRNTNNGVAAIYETLNAGAGSPSFQMLNPNTSFGSFVREIVVANRQGAWQADPNFPLSLDQGAESYDPDTIYVLSSNGLWVTKNHGQAWFNRSAGLPAINTISSIHVDPRNRDVVYVTVNSFGGGKVFRSTNAGVTWTNISANLPDSPAWDVTVNARTGDVFVGNDQGVYVLVGGAGNWTRFGEGMPQVQVRELVINSVTNTITAGTYGRGVFQLQLDDVRVNGGGIRAVTGSSVWTGPVQVVGDLDIRAETGAQINFLGNISEIGTDAFEINKLGQGKVIFSGVNSYQGVTNVVEGALVVRNPFALGSSGDDARTIVFTGAALELQSNLALETVELNGNGTQFNGHFTGALRNVSNDNVFTGKLILNVPASGPNNNPPLPSDTSAQITIGVDSGSTLTIGVDTSANPIPGVGVIEDAGPARTLTKELTGTLIFNSENTFAGLVQVNQGILRVANSLALGATDNGVLVRNGAQLELARDPMGNSLVIADERLVLSGTGIFDAGALRNVSGDNEWTGDVFLRQITALPAPPPSTPPSKVSINVVDAADTLTLSGVISEQDPDSPPPPAPPSMGLDKIGPGRLTLTNDNTYSGVTNVLAGALQVQSTNSLGTTTSGTVVSSGASLELFSDTGVVFAAEQIVLNGMGIAPGNLGALRNVAGDNAWTGQVILNTTVPALGGGANPQVFIGADAGSELLIQGDNLVRDPAGVPATFKAAELHKVGNGIVALTGSNGYAGATVVQAGVLNVRNDTSLGTLLNEVQTITIAGLGGQFRLTFEGQETANIAASATAATIQSALEALSTIGAGNVTVTRTGNFVVVTFVGTLAGTNLSQMTGFAFAGTSISIAKVQNGGAGGGTTVQNGGTLQLQDGITVSDEALTLNGPGFNAAGALENLSGNNTWDSSILLGSNSFIGVTGAADVLTIPRAITDNGQARSLTKVGPGTLEFVGGAGTGNTYTGLTQVNQGTLRLNKTDGELAIGGNLTVGDGVAGNASVLLQQPEQIVNAATVIVNEDGLLDLNGLAETIATLRILDGDVFTRNNGQLNLTNLEMVGGRLAIGTGGSTTLNGNVSGTSSATETALIDGAGELDLNGATRSFTVANGPQAVDLSIDVEVTGNAGVNKLGGGVMELDEVNTYTGVTTIFAGTLQVDGQIGNVDLEGGTLSGTGTTGTVNGGDAVTPAVGTVSPGNSTGILNTGSTLWGPQTTYFVELNNTTPGTGYDQLQVTGSIDLGGATLAGLVGPDVVVGNTFTIITATGGVTGTFAEGNEVLFGGIKFRILYNPNSVVITPIANTNVVVTALPPTIALGESVQFTALVTAAPPATGNPTGLVEFYDGQINPANLIGQGMVDPITGLISINTSALSVGTHTIIALYTGDENFNSGQGELQFVVGPATTSTSVVVAPSPSVFGQTVQFVATVSSDISSNGVPTGTVTFLIDGVEFQSVGLNAEGEAMLSTNSLLVGTRMITARFNGNSTFALSSDTTTHVVNRANTLVSVSSTLNPSAVGQPVTINATVQSVAPGSGVPNGVVTFFVNGVNRGNAPVVNGVASLPIAFTTQGISSITATYNGSGNYEPSNSTPIQQSVVQFATNTTLMQTANPSVFGQLVTFTAVVRGGPFGGAMTTVPPGSVTFIVDGVVRGTVGLNPNGVSRIKLSLATGTHQVIARYNPTPSFATSSDTVEQVVNKANTGVSVTSNRPTALVGQPITVTATVQAVPPGGGVPAGTVTFFVNGVEQAPQALNAQGRASLNLGALPLGQTIITATYSGSANHNESTSAPFVQNVVTQLPVAKITGGLLNPPSIGSPFAIRAFARDENNGLVPTYNAPVRVALLAAPAGGGLAGPRNTQFVNGVATFTNLSVTRAGRYVLRIISGNLFFDIVVVAQGRLV